MTILIEFKVILLNMLEVILLNKFEMIFPNKFELIPMETWRLQQVPPQMPVTPGYGRGTARDRAHPVVDDLERWGVVGGEDANDDAWNHVTDV